MKDKLILLVGASGTGKTTIAKELEKEDYNIIHSYTNRKPREPNEWGHTFENLYSIEVSNVFVGVENGVDPDSQDFKCIDIDDMIAYFNDYDKNEHYFATFEQYQGKGTSIYIVDPEGAEMVKENVEDAEIVTILLTTDKSERIYRLINRMKPYEETFGKIMRGNKKEKAEAMSITSPVMDRIESDRVIFSTVKCDYAIDANRDLKEVLEDVIRVIGG